METKKKKDQMKYEKEAEKEDEKLTFLSQPGIEILASYHCAAMTVSILSAIRSLDCRL